jgi:hypothetical protein
MKYFLLCDVSKQGLEIAIWLTNRRIPGTCGHGDHDACLCLTRSAPIPKQDQDTPPPDSSLTKIKEANNQVDKLDANHAQHSRAKHLEKKKVKHDDLIGYDSSTVGF